MGKSFNRGRILVFMYNQNNYVNVFSKYTLDAHEKSVFYHFTNLIIDCAFNPFYAGSGMPRGYHSEGKKMSSTSFSFLCIST